jgi:hypothetical protein
METSALLMLEVVTHTSNSFYRICAISYRYSLGFSCKCLCRASNIRGVTLLSCLTLFEGALVKPKQQRFLFIAQMERLLQLATSAILSALNDLLWIILPIIACFDSGRFGAILDSQLRLGKTLLLRLLLGKFRDVEVCAHVLAQN